MKWIVPIVIIGLVGGIMDEITELNKVWCFLIGVAAFIVLLLIKSIFIAARIMLNTKGKKKIWIDQNNNVINSE